MFLTAEQATQPMAFWGSYAATKAGLEALVRCWADEVATTSNIRALLLDPGAVRTKLRAEAYPGEDKEALTLPDEVAAMILDIIQRPDPGLPNTTISLSRWRCERSGVSSGTP